jgi:hypothetical protein
MAEIKMKKGHEIHGCGGSKGLLNLKSQMVGGVATIKFLGCALVFPSQPNNDIFIIFIC